MNKSAGVLIILLQLFYCSGLLAQKVSFLPTGMEADSLQIIIHTTEGNEYSGMVTESSDSFLVIQPVSKVLIRIRKEKIKDFEILERVITENNSKLPQQYYFENPHATRYFYGPNGYGLKENEGYYQNLWVMFNQVSLGFSDYFSVGTGIIPLFLFAGAPTPFWVTPKFSFPVQEDRFNIGIGALAGTIVGESETSFGIPYATFTLGTRDRNTTLGAGWAYTSEGFAKTPAYTLSSMVRLSRKAYFITENYLIRFDTESIGILSGGARIVQRKLAVDFGLVVPVNVDIFIAFPWLSITIPFGV